MDIKYPEISVQLTGEDGNAFSIIAAVSRAATEFWDEATSGDYDHLLATAMRWVDVS